MNRIFPNCYGHTRFASAEEAQNAPIVEAKKRASDGSPIWIPTSSVGYLKEYYCKRCGGYHLEVAK